MRSLTLFFYSVVSYLLGAIAYAVTAPYVAPGGPSSSTDPALAFIPVVQATGSLLFLGLAIAVLLGDILESARGQDAKLAQKVLEAGVTKHQDRP